MYTVKLTAIAAESIRRLDPTSRDTVLKRIEELAIEPEKFGKSLKGPLKGMRSVRVLGQRYRIIYTVEHGELLVVIVAVGIRTEGDKKDIYQLMKKYLRTGLLD